MRSVRASLTTSSGQPPVFDDLQDALAGALAEAGVSHGVSVDSLAAHEDGLVHVLVPAAYMPYVHPAAHPSPPQMRRTVLVVTDAPGDAGFERAAALAESAAATLVLDAGAASELAHRGIRVRALRLGYVPAWDGWCGLPEAERDVDVAVVAEYSDRRALALSRSGAALSGRRTALHLLRHPLTPASAEVTPIGARKRELLSRTKLLLCVHQAESRAFDWLSALPALANGCVVLSEQPEHHGPLVAGRHFDCTDFHSIPAAIEGVLGSPERIERIRADAYDFIRAERPLSEPADVLREAIESVGAAARPARAREKLATPMPRPRDGPAPAVERLREAPAEGDLMRAALKQTLLRQRRLERELLAQENGAAPDDRVVEIGEVGGPAPRVSAVVTLYNYAHTIADALRSVALSDLDEVELVLVDDASTDDSLAVARATLAELPWLGGRIVERGANGGLARARNLGLEHARAEYAFVLDADNAVHRTGLRRLADALDSHPEAHFAYGVIRTLGPSGPMGLTSWAPWDPWWLRIDNYIDAMAMVRRASVLEAGGYTTEEALYGWEDFELWCNLASRGMPGTFVPEFVADYSTGRQSMISLTTLDSTDGWTALLDRYEFLREQA